MQGLFRDFITDAGPSGDDWQHRRMWPYAVDPLSFALGKLRAHVGVKIGDITRVYRVDVSDDLATIIPDQQEWFFDRFE